MEVRLQACPRGWEALTSGAGMIDEKKKSKLADDPNPQLPPPPLSRARLAAKVEQVFAENLPSTKAAKKAPTIKQLIEKPVKSAVDDKRPIKRKGRPPGKKPPKTLAERQQTFRDRKRKEKS